MRLGRDAKNTFFFSRHTREASCEARAPRACKTLTPRFTGFLTDFERKNRLFCSLTYSSKREQSNERSGTRLKMESETGERRYGRVRLRACQTLTPLFTDFLTDFEKKPDCFAIYTVVIIRRCIAVQYLLKKSEM